MNYSFQFDVNMLHSHAIVVMECTWDEQLVLPYTTYCAIQEVSICAVTSDRNFSIWLIRISN